MQIRTGRFRARIQPTTIANQPFRCRVYVLRISEIYQSIQGEGEFTGTSSVFVRTTGCNLRCWFCDTPFTSWAPEGNQQTIDQVLTRIAEFDARHVVVTGGEPLLLPDIVPLTVELRQRGYFVTLETAGTAYRAAAADLMSISPKLANSTPSIERSRVWSQRHEQRRHRPDTIRSLISESAYQFKFVIDQPEDVTQVDAWLVEFPEIDRARVWLMPQATTREELAAKNGWIQQAAETAGFQFTSRLHIEQFGNTRGY
jgi:7-carboxy-7-deazaguanine synthase